MVKNAFWQLHGKKVLVIGVILSLIGAWTYGEINLSTDVEQYFPEVMPEATTFELIASAPSENQYLYSASADGTQVGFITTGQGQGYGGPMLIEVAWGMDGTILNVLVPEHQETEAWYGRLAENEHFIQYIGRTFSEPFTLGEDIDKVSGATRSSTGVAQGVYNSRLLLAEHLGQPYVGPKVPIKFGSPEILLLVGLGLVMLFRLVPALRKLRWTRGVMLAFGFIIFGIALSGMLSLINFILFPIGYAPSPITNLYLYLIVFGIIGLALIFGKNFWCFWICPYCAVQETAHFIGGSKARPVTRRQLMLRNTRYIILWVVVLMVLIFRQPQLAVFEPWNTLFSLEGSVIQWLLVAVTIGIAMFIHDFWCHYLCPVGATMDIVLKIRAWFAGAFGRLTSR
ncbi:MAG: 4Fe-4S binding protein [Dehalogenimonas sp.]|uniref:4Fe-4S binding protein n=1 Tax=Candidatus Dehalogenimonas loeffleri TaxID=3127115 RepID=A0ABZ2JA81_9CHLR|nr:4Fe-4S binding protein [Dehalogenimonas sp.]